MTVARGTDLADELGVTYRQVHHWAKQGYVVPEGGTLPQGGIALRFNDTEQRIVRVMARLVTFGIKPDVASAIARQHVESSRNTFQTTIFEIDDVGELHVYG